MNKLNFISSLSPSIKAINSIIIVGYLFSFSETAVQVSQYIDGTAKKSLFQIFINIYKHSFTFLGTFCYSRKFASFDICNLDMLYFLFHRNTYLGRFDRYYMCYISF